MNSPKEQATLYRKAAETIEMCAEHGIEPMVKYKGDNEELKYAYLNNDYDRYEFPLAAIEGQLVWADTIVYNSGGYAMPASGVSGLFGPYTITPPKQPLCKVEGKPVYKGDKLYARGCEVIVNAIDDCIGSLCVIVRTNVGSFYSNQLSWNPPKRTVMVELPMNTVEAYAATNIPGGNGFRDLTQIVMACRKALDNLK